MADPIPLTEWQALVQESTSELSPAKLNDALDKRLSFVTTNLALIATVATGFGLFADRSGALQAEADQLKLAFTLLLAAVVVSLIGSAPNWFNKVSPSDLDAVEQYFTKRYRWRAWAARIAIALFTVAVLAVGSALSDTLGRSTAPVLGLSYATGEKPTVTATVSVTGLEPGSVLDTTVRGCTPPTGAKTCVEGASQLLARDSTRVESTAKIEIKLAVAPIPVGLTQFDVAVVSGGKTYERSLDIS